jgi:hypothetical protein
MMAFTFPRRPLTVLLVPMLAIALFVLTMRDAEAAKPGPSTACTLTSTDYSRCAVTLNPHGRAPDVVALTLFDCATNGPRGVLIKSATKGEIVVLESTTAGGPAYLLVSVWAGGRTIAYEEDRSLCTT